MSEGMPVRIRFKRLVSLSGRHGEPRSYGDRIHHLVLGDATDFGGAIQLMPVDDVRLAPVRRISFIVFGALCRERGKAYEPLRTRRSSLSPDAIRPGSLCSGVALKQRRALRDMATKTIEANSSGTRALRCAARHFARRASRALASPGLSDSAVHDARKDLKRARTALRLLRPALGEPVYRRENARLRDVAHALNAARDAKVLTQTLQSLRRCHRALRRDADVAELLRTLQADQAGLRRRLRGHPAQLARTRGALQQLCDRVPRWHVGTHGWSVLGPASKRIYRSGRRGLSTARPRPAERALHEWRKQVKYLRYALEMLAPMRARKVARLARQAEQLTDCLGEAHDLAMLAHRARVFAKGNRAGLRPLFTIIEQQRDRLGREALSSGEQLYRAKPGDWQRQLGRYWIRWRRTS